MLDLTKPVQTRDGRPARILATDLNNRAYPTVAAITQNDGQELVHTYTSQGRGFSGGEGDLDLVNVPDRTITLELTPEQAAALWVVTQNIGGHPYNTPRGYIDKIAHKLAAPYYLELAPVFNDNSHYFEQTNHHFTAIVDYFREKAAQ